MSANLGRVYSVPSPTGQGTVSARPVVFVILGGTGDLARRKLVPAIFEIVRQGLIPQPVHIVGAAGSDLTHEEFRGRVAEAVREFARVKPGSDAELVEFLSHVFYQSVKFQDAGSFRELKLLLDELERGGASPHRIFYLATPPSAYGPIVQNLQAVGLADRRDDLWPRVVIEKPFGRDLPSALELNQVVLSVFDEHQVYRIDHYLGKETVQNIMVFRFANGIFEPTWNRRYIDHVQITVAEEIGIGSRGRYYEEAGVIRDMVQNHMLQILSMIAMEPPTSFHADSIRDERVKVLKCIRPIPVSAINEHVVRAQYGSGLAKGSKVWAYREEDNVAAESMTETYIAIKLFIENWRWAGVPFYLRSGKYLPKRVTEVAIQYRGVPHMLFRDVLTDPLEPSALILRIQPDEGISLTFSTKHPGMLMDIRNQAMDFNYYEAYGDKAPDAYERLLLDVVVGDGTLFPRTDAVVASWKFVDQIVEGWRASRVRNLPQYEPGSWGPVEAVEMMAADQRKWRRP
ncbi:MAG: glucose-6-phosphate dehydrogenase [Deltaproteobacteria bacterium]|nr:glucose-6-phosphate dehydrogenase [Deltaproteobacteria bacterium]